MVYSEQKQNNICQLSVVDEFYTAMGCVRPDLV